MLITISVPDNTVRLLYVQLERDEQYEYDREGTPRPVTVDMIEKVEKE